MSEPFDLPQFDPKKTIYFDPSNASQGKPIETDRLDRIIALLERIHALLEPDGPLEEARKLRNLLK